MAPSGVSTHAVPLSARTRAPWLSIDAASVVAAAAGLIVLRALAIELMTGELTQSRTRDWLRSIAMCMTVWESISALMPFADLAGPSARVNCSGDFRARRSTIWSIDSMAGPVKWSIA